MSHLSINQIFFSTEVLPEKLLSSLGEEVALTENGNLSFHWSDFSETCEIVKNHLSVNPVLAIEFKKKENSTRLLDRIPVWIRTKSKVLQTTVFQLYEQFLFNQQHLIGTDPFSAIDISFISASGPFKKMAVTECFNEVTYRDFVLVNLIKGELPRRDFRIRLKSKVLLESGTDFESAFLVRLEQLGTRGLLLSLDHKAYVNHFQNAHELRLLLDSSFLRSSLTADLSEMRNHFSKFTFNLFYSSRSEDGLVFQAKEASFHSSFDRLRSNRIHLFVPYGSISKDGKAAVKDLRRFVEHSRDLVLKHYHSGLGLRSA